MKSSPNGCRICERKLKRCIFCGHEAIKPERPRKSRKKLRKEFIDFIDVKMKKFNMKTTGCDTIDKEIAFKRVTE